MSLHQILDILDAFKDKKIASMISIDGGHMINNSLSMLRLYYDAGVRFMSLTHKCNTAWLVYNGLVLLYGFFDILYNDLFSI